MKRVRIIRAEHGTGERVVDVSKEGVTDLWHIANSLRNKAAREAVIDVWHYAHELRTALLIVANGADTSKPIHTK